jgi:hypothetical protein
MSYLDKVEKELRDRFANEPSGNDMQEPTWDEWVKEIVSFVREKLLESYKNGAQAARQSRFAGQRGGQPNPSQKSKASK